MFLGPKRRFPTFFPVIPVICPFVRLIFFRESIKFIAF
jgi:hypothetical protein